MSEAEVEMIDSHLSPSCSVVEWGMGGSTVHLSGTVGRLVSVEHDFKWYQAVAGSMPVRYGVTLCHVPLSCTPPGQGDSYPAGYRRAWREYVEHPREIAFGAGKFDAALVDGRARLFCAIEAAERLVKPGGFIFVHDYFHRPRYWLIEQWCAVVDSIRDGQSLVVLQVPA